MKKVVIIFILAVFPLLLTGCFFKNSDRDVHFSSSQPLELAPDVKWAVVTEPYSAYYTGPSWEAATDGHCRRNDILQIKGESIRTASDNTTEKWYEFDKGWLPASSISIYSNRLRAKTAAAQSKQ